MTSLEGTVTSVGYPGPYPINSQCTWYIRGPEKARVILTFHDLSVHEGRDFVLVGEGWYAHCYVTSGDTTAVSADPQSE